MEVTSEAHKENTIITTKSYSIRHTKRMANLNGEKVNSHFKTTLDLNQKAEKGIWLMLERNYRVQTAITDHYCSYRN